MTMLKDKIGNFFSGDSRTLNVKKNVIASIILRGIGILSSFLLVPLTIGYVSSEIYGVWLTLSSVLAWLGFLDIGFTQGLKNRLTEALAKGDLDRGKALVSTTYFLMICLFVPACIILQLIIPYVDWCALLHIDSIYASQIMLSLHALIAFACIQMIINVIVSVVAAYQKVALSNSFNVIGSVLSLIVIYILTKTCQGSLLILTFTIGLMPVLVALIASVFLYTYRFSQVAPTVSHIKLNLIKDLFNLGYKFFLINIQVIIIFQSTNFLISYVSSPNDVTIYNVAYKYLNIAMMGYAIIVAPLWPAYTDAYVKGDFEWMKTMRKKMEKILLLSLGCLSLMVVISPFVYKIWIGDSVEVPFIMTFLVALYVAFYCVQSLNGTLLTGMGKISISTIVTTMGMIVHIPLSLFFSSYIGVYGVVSSMVLIVVFYSVMMYIQVNKILTNKATGIWLK